MKKALFALAICLTATLAWSQDKPLKIGYTNANYIFSLSPRSKEIESEIKTRSTQLRKEIEKKEEDYRSKFEEYDKNKGSMSNAIRQSKEDEIRALEQNIMNLRQNAETEIKNKSDELIAPESEKISKAIKEVATENGYTYIFNGDPQIMLYGTEALNVTDLVLKKLNINPPAAGGTTTTEEKTPAEPAKPIMAKPGATKGGAKKK